jgi:DNA primase
MQATETAPTQKVVVNAPLNFELKRLDTEHPYLTNKGFTKETIHHFGLGFCSKGLLAGRIAIPIHNSEGKLVGYCGRLAEDRAISEEHPRYKFPPKREHQGMSYEFQKSKLLYNSHRLKSPVEDLAIVEGFASVWWLTQMGFPNVVALMGWSMSAEQAELVMKLVTPKGRAWLLQEGDEAGQKCAASVMEQIAPLRSLRLIKLEEGKQPTDYPGGWYKERFEK